MKIHYPLTLFPVKFEMKKGQRQYTLTLDSNQVQDLAFVDGGSGIVGVHPSTQTWFHIYHSYKSAKSFRPMPGPECGYYSYIGDMKNRTVADMVKLLKRLSPMPIEMNGAGGIPINLGYVHFKTTIGSIDETLK